MIAFGREWGHPELAETRAASGLSAALSALPRVQGSRWATARDALAPERGSGGVTRLRAWPLAFSDRARGGRS